MDTVISKGNIKLLDIARWTIIFEQFASIVIIRICFLIILAVTFLFRKSLQHFLHSALLTTILSLSLFTELCSLSFIVYTHAMIDSENINRKVALSQKWKEKTAIPFIKSLPPQQ